MRFSVVINTYNRGRSLRETLKALRHQTHPDFEVVVVNGPSTDDTEAVLAEFAGAVRVARCPEVHLSKSRNVGIAAASGEVLAFIDDDGVPEPHWLRDLDAAYDDARVGGAGGLVYDHTGMRLQYRYSVCDRIGDPRFDVWPPFTDLVKPGADPFVYLQGTNCSFRRDCLVRIGGFDEEIEYYLDEVEVCLRILDSGFVVRPLDNAIVHHKYLASHLRTSKRVVTNPYAIVKNRHYFAYQNGRATRTAHTVAEALRTYTATVLDGGNTLLADGKFTAAQHDHFVAQVHKAVEVGTQRGLTGQRYHRELPPGDPGQFLPYPTVRPDGKRLTVCFISQEYPPGDFGGIGRFTADLATGFAAAGHEVHVVTRSPDADRVDYEDGVWLHRLAAPERHLPELDGVPLRGVLLNSAAAFHEVKRIHARGAVDVVSAPLWACEGLVTAMAAGIPTVLTLMTSLKTVAGLHPSWGQSEDVRQVIAAEHALARRSPFLHAISDGILRKVRQDYGDPPGDAFVIPLGVRDRRAEYAPTRSHESDGRVRVLFVGRLERRKGIDLLLAAAVQLLEEFPAAEFVLAGKDTPNTETGTTYRAAFQKEFADRPDVLNRLTFAGAVTEAELHRHYADCDIFCLPSRYESFGLVLVEAMVFGKPVVGCNVGGMPEIVRPGENGYLAEPEDAASLAAALRPLLADAGQREAFGRRSREIFEEVFDLPRVVARTAARYRRVAEATASAGGPAALAEVLAETTGLPRVQCALAAASLLDRRYYPVDPLAGVRRIWDLPDEAFVRELFPLLLKRDADLTSFRFYLGRLHAGESRQQLVAQIARSDEAAFAGLTTHWLGDLDLLPAPAAGAAAPARGPWGRVRRVLGRVKRAVLSAKVRRVARAVLSWRKLAQFVKRSLYLPWHFPRLQETAQQTHATVCRLHLEQREHFVQFSANLTAGHQRQREAQAVLLQHLQEGSTLLQEEVRHLRLVQAEHYGALAEQQRVQAEALRQLADAARGDADLHAQLRQVQEQVQLQSRSLLDLTQTLRRILALLTDQEQGRTPPESEDQFPPPRAVA